MELATGPLDGVPAGAGERSVELARASLEALLARGDAADAGPVPGSWGPFFELPRGVFVTLLSYPEAELRGCVGFPRAVFPLRTGIARAAASAALDDPRFPPLTARELPRTLVEVSLLTEPRPLPTSEREHWPHLLRVGRDGLIVETRHAGGLLLPQVAPDQGWDATEFLRGTCVKAGLAEEAWRRPEVSVLTFQALVVREERPRGRAVRHSV